MIVNSLYRLFPIAVPNKMLFCEMLLQRGVNAYRGATQLTYVRSTHDHKEAENAKWLMEQVIYLPVHASNSDSDARDIIERTIDTYKNLVRYLKNQKVQPTKVKSKELLERAKL